MTPTVTMEVVTTEAVTVEEATEAEVEVEVEATERLDPAPSPLTMSKKTKIALTLGVIAGILAVGVRNFIRARHATAHNTAIDSLRQPAAATPSTTNNTSRLP